MRHTVILIGKVKNQECRAMIAEYLKRMQNDMPCTFLELKEGKDLPIRLLEYRNKSLLVALAIEGKHFSSEQFAQFVRKQEKPITFIIGNEDGLPVDVVCKADLCLSLSEMTLPHELAAVVLMEQLYRALTIIKGHPYHR